ncbi:DUF2785 domain-containing protein [Lacticaseibacillus camelliae]|nr:DUF2785 domain-containing protein [Lacticaseibacillus camelliae]
MQQALEAKLNEADPLTFTGADVAWLIAHVGDLDGHIRDDLTFTLIARGVLAGGFTAAQQRRVNDAIVASKQIFSGIDAPQNNAVFLRSFTALIGSCILQADAQRPFLTRTDRGLWFQWALEYLYRERDWRGYVAGHGFAHALAHGSDLLAAALAHPLFGSARQEVVLGTVRAVLDRIIQPLAEDEEERLANALKQGLQAHTLSQATLTHFLTATDQALWQGADSERAAGYRLSAWKRVLQTLYFLAPSLQQACLPLLRHYYRENGYLES